jgi:hypothetical protein
MIDARENNHLQGTFTKPVKRPRYGGANRRATAILPEPSGEHGHEMTVDKYQNYNQLLTAIRANKQTCCVKFSSEKRKSRGAILVFRGQVLGVIYGRKDLNGKIFHQEAYSLALKDLFDQETEVIAHIFSEPLAAATAALFHGQFGVSSEQKVGENAFTEYYQKVTDAKIPGCILVRDKEQLTVFAAYIYNGKMVALYSGTEGWLPATVQVALQKMSQRGEVTVTSAVLKIDDISEVNELTFALSGIEGQIDKGHTGPKKPKEQASSLPSNQSNELSRKDSVPSALVAKKINSVNAERERSLRQRLGGLQG